MKKALSILLLVLVSVVLAACGSSENAEGDSEGNQNEAKADEESSSDSGQEEKSEKESTFENAESGDSVSDDWGTYQIVKTTTPETTSYTSEPIKFNIPKVMLATFKPSEENKDFFDQEEIKLAIALINTENTSEDTVNFHPFSAKVTTNTQGQYSAQQSLNKGDSEHIGKVKEEFVMPYNLEDENLSEITKLNFHFDGTAKDSMTTGDDVEVSVSFE